MFGAEIAVGYVFRWLAARGRAAEPRLDGQVDSVVDAAVDRLGGKLHDLVAGRLSADPTMTKLADEASQGANEPSERTKARVALAVEDAAEQDPGFAAAIEDLLRQLKEAQGAGTAVSASDGGVAAGGDVRVSAERGSLAAAVVQGNVNFGNPTVPGTE